MLEPARRSLSILTALALTLGCSDSPLAPFEPEITNATNSFQLQATGVRDLSTTLDYTWQNTDTIADIDHSTTTTGGSARLVVLDADGRQVYDAALVPSLNERTAAGTSGAWTVRVVLASYSGTLNFRVQKP